MNKHGIGPIRLPESIRVASRIRRGGIDERGGGWGGGVGPALRAVSRPSAGLRRGPPISARSGYGFFGAGATAGATAGAATGTAARPIISAYFPFRSRIRAAYDELRMILSNCPR
jgi:hypothetical protein